ncbi:MAG: hypothetical protein ABIR32_09500 [Ilumatobacteraceae bacterium]
MRRSTVFTGVAVALVMISAGCGSSATKSSASDLPVTVFSSPDTSTTLAVAESSTTIVAETTTSVAAETTVAPPPTEAATTIPPTTIATVPGGWVDAEFGPSYYAPLDESNYVGVPSPAFPTDPTAPLFDGIYDASPTNGWSPDSPSTLELTVHRLDSCTVLPESACVTYGDPFDASEMGVDIATSFALTVPLDATIGAGVTGRDCEGVVRRGNGADLLDLFTSFDQAYHVVIAPQIEAGVEPFDILQAVVANPSNGFTGHGPGCSDSGVYEVVYHHGEAPPLLMQTVVATKFDADGNIAGISAMDPTDALALHTIGVQGGVITLYFYAGFYS